MPPIATGVGLPWDLPVEDPVAALAEARFSCGDTFVVDSGPDRYLFTFSPAGVAAFYALAEDQASKGMADWRMLSRKLPEEIFAGRRTLPHALFGREDVAAYLANLERALDATVDELGASGAADVFGLTRRLGHRMGLASWGGPGSAEGASFERLVDAFDVLDGAEAFVHPDAMAAVAVSEKAT
ncbi:MAG: cytochrome P450, partial [Acidimicrobiales bacterium]